MTRPRAADGFPAIRARIEELRRDGARAPVDDDRRRTDGPQPYATGTRPVLDGKTGTPPAIRHAVWR